MELHWTAHVDVILAPHRFSAIVFMGHFGLDLIKLTLTNTFHIEIVDLSITIDPLAVFLTQITARSAVI